MARKTAIRITNDEISRAEYVADARKDATAENGRKLRVLDESVLGVRTAAERREARGLMEPSELLKLAKSAARLELRGAMFSADDRQDVSAAIMLAVLESTGGSMPRHGAERVTLGRLCGDAKNFRRSIEARRERDRIDTEERAAEHATTAAAIGADHTPAEHAAIVARSGRVAAERAASAICADLGLDATPDGPVWSVFYVWARGEDMATCAAERDQTHGAYRVKCTRGAKLVRGAYDAASLVRRLTLGATQTTDALVYVLRDDSREAHGHTPLLADVATAPHWREGTADGARAERPTDAHTAREACTLRRMAARDRVHWRKRREHLATHTAATAEALTTLAREHARHARRERAASATSPLATPSKD